MERAVDWRLCIITCAELSRNRSHQQVVAAAIVGGATIIQLRDKEASISELIAVGKELRRLTYDAGVTFIVNDHIDVALAVQADGIHLGTSDTPLAQARRKVGPKMIIGFSPTTLAEGITAHEADYLGVGPVYPTSTKSDAGTAIGLVNLRKFIEQSRLPVIAIGGINADNVHDVIITGAAGVAVISAVVAADDITATTAHLRQLIEAAQRRR
ncbi:thiamine phosphate synthase [Candidatus Acetothermia bacterium]|nr:thiamine phosphate synthase [Candidatus Acetothermia bacterium]MCI2426941.1 thiamine phosphate synthase [Candidatus Acetothermia bacterium]MCI2428639.1 thiamine phosphate synthase [Candidatus Acetothermia bacterium]